MALRSTFLKLVGPFPSAKISGLASIPVGARGIAGKNFYQPDPKKPKPFPYWKRGYEGIWRVIDKTTLRLDENSKLICVEGAHAIGKSKFAAELAEELNMIHVHYPRMDEYYINQYGLDWRKFNDIIPVAMRPFDEKDFSRNPLGWSVGCPDRMFIFLYRLKYYLHLFAIRHILNTGQGVVLEGSVFSDYAYFDAAYNQGWLLPVGKKIYKEHINRSLHHILKPNLIIYLDAPAEVVMKNIEARGNEWDKNSPVWTNKSYLEDIYNELKNNYLKQMQPHCRVLAYDWSTPGDTEIVVEDIEALNFDYLEFYDTQQATWRFNNEEIASEIRSDYSCMQELTQKINCFEDMEEYWLADELCFEHEDMDLFNALAHWTETERFAVGFNKKLGDKNILWKEGLFHNFNNRNLFDLGQWENVRKNTVLGLDYDGVDLDMIKAARAEGLPQIVKSHNRSVLHF